jgi:chromosome segregation ATPase
MSNVLTYTLSLQDQVSAKLKTIGISSDTMLNKFASLQKKSQEVSHVLRDTGNSVGSLKQKVDLLKAEREWIPQTSITSIKATNAEIKKLENQIYKLENTAKGGGIGSSISNAFSPFSVGWCCWSKSNIIRY